MNPTPPNAPDLLPVLPFRDAVLFPFALTPVAITEQRAIKLVDDAMRTHRRLAVVAARKPDANLEDTRQLYTVGTASMIQQLFRVREGMIRLVLMGVERVRIDEYPQTQPYLIGRAIPYPEKVESGIEVEALARSARELFRRFIGLTNDIPQEISAALASISDPRQLVYQLAALSPLPVEDRQALLELDEVSRKLERLVSFLQHEIAIREIQRKITSETREQISKDQRNHVLREQLRQIHRELGDESEETEAEDLREQIEKAHLPPEARKEADRELARLSRIPAASPEHGIIRTYLEWMAALPWGRTTGQSLDVQRAREVLDADHHDLEEVKDRILEHLAVMKLRDERQVAKPSAEPAAPDVRREPILCLVGPPGVGKTSLGKSISKALGRKFVRISLGGIQDEAEIRGHRRTYIGAMPGRIIQALRRAEAMDPVFMLDEVDKLGIGLHGDPSAALLEVLDPAQNNSFVDTYLGVPFDLSRVLFICTANTMDTIAAPLLDRMEVLRLPGYTDLEKVQIAKRFLLPRLRLEHGLSPEEVSIDDAAITRVIREYTREAGVRSLERQLAGIVRKAARRIAEGGPPAQVGPEQVHEYLGRAPYFEEVVERIDRPGIATGLAWTPTGGDILFVEAAIMPSDEERLLLTGKLGEVMRESAQAALSYLRANAALLGIDSRVFDGKLVHVHVPAGAIPKDGPSAGVTIATALASAATGRPVRNDLALTGEISLRGKVLPVGGIKEKVLAAHRAGLKTVVLPKRNESSLEKVPDEVRGALHFEFVESMDEVLEVALEPRPAWHPHPTAAEPPLQS